MNQGWSQAEIALAAKLWREGHSAGQIAHALAAELGRCHSRSAVCGLMARDRALFPKRGATSEPGWSEAEISLAALLWAKGFSATSIAQALREELGTARTRSAICGMMARQRARFPARPGLAGRPRA